ncbi:hypothetical protein [Fervidobacterium sp.]
MEKLALERLELAPENLRQEPDLEALEALKASIREVGLLKGLVGYEQGGRVFVVAGGHCLRAPKALAAEGHPVGEVPVRLVPREKALLLSLTENLARKDLDPLEEAEAVGRLLREGLSPEAVARELGRTPAWVRARGRVAEGLSPSWRGLLMDLGNGDRYGQVVLGRGTLEAPWPHERFPELVAEGEDEGPSCSVLEALTRQDLVVNDLAAVWAAALLWDLARGKKPAYLGVVYDLDRGTTRAIPWVGSTE